MKSASVRTQARKEMAKERDRILRIKREASSPLEKEALAWEKDREAAGRIKQKESLKREAEGAFDLQEFLTPQITQSDEDKLSKETDWTQYKPWKREKTKTRKEKRALNMATIRALAKRIISKELARIQGKPQNSDLYNLERGASSLKKRKEEEERRKEEVRLKRKRQREISRKILKERREEEKRRNEEIMLKMSRQEKIIQELLFQFGQELREKQDILMPEDSAALLEKKLENAGEVFHIEWHKQECCIWIEPWEERKIRRNSGDALPVVYRAKIDENLELVSYVQEDSENVRSRMREQALAKALQGISINDKEEAEKVLEEALSKIGRIISLKRTKKGWNMSFEPWEKVRLRKIKNNGKGPVVSTQIEINWTEGKFNFVPK